MWTNTVLLAERLHQRFVVEYKHSPSMEPGPSKGGYVLDRILGRAAAVLQTASVCRIARLAVLDGSIGGAMCERNLALPEMCLVTKRKL